MKNTFNILFVFVLLCSLAAIFSSCSDESNEKVLFETEPIKKYSGNSIDKAAKVVECDLKGSAMFDYGTGLYQERGFFSSVSIEIVDRLYKKFLGNEAYLDRLNSRFSQVFTKAKYYIPKESNLPGWVVRYVNLDTDEPKIVGNRGTANLSILQRNDSYLMFAEHIGVGEGIIITTLQFQPGLVFIAKNRNSVFGEISYYSTSIGKCSQIE